MSDSSRRATWQAMALAGVWAFGCAEPSFVSLGRHAQNDIHVPDESLSRFHAFFRELPTGALVLQDAKSANGTLLRGGRVPQQG